MFIPPLVFFLYKVTQQTMGAKLGYLCFHCSQVLFTCMGAVEMRESVSIVLTDEKPSPILIAKGEVLFSSSFFLSFFFLSLWGGRRKEEGRKKKKSLSFKR